MDDIKRAWVSYFVAIRDSRRKDMRQYATISVGSILTIVLFVSTSTLTGSIFPRTGPTVRTERGLGRVEVVETWIFAPPFLGFSSRAPRATETAPASRAGWAGSWVFTSSFLGYSPGGLIFLGIVSIVAGFFWYWFRNQYKTAEEEIKDYDDAIEWILMHAPLRNEEYQSLFSLLRLRKWADPRLTDWGRWQAKTDYFRAGFISRRKYIKTMINRDGWPSLTACWHNSEVILDNLKAKGKAVAEVSDRPGRLAFSGEFRGRIAYRDVGRTAP